MQLLGCKPTRSDLPSRNLLNDFVRSYLDLVLNFPSLGLFLSISRVATRLKRDFIFCWTLIESPTYSASALARIRCCYGFCKEGAGANVDPGLGGWDSDVLCWMCVTFLQGRMIPGCCLYGFCIGSGYTSENC